MVLENKIYGSVLEAKDYCIHKDGHPFSQSLYDERPEEFKSIFHEKFAPHSTALVNGIYWEPRFPRILTKEQVDGLLADPRSKLLTIADISCDINVHKFIDYLSRRDQ